MQTLERVQIPTAGGHTAVFACRPDTNDAALAHGIIEDREYPFERLQYLSGWAIDLGAHIGIVTVALALDNPELEIVAVEALSENAEMLRENVSLNALRNVTVLCAAAGKDEDTLVRFGYSHVDGEPDGYVADNRFIGNIYARGESESRQVPGVSLTTLLERYGIDRVTFLKSDTEGAEWAYLKDPAMAKVDWAVGEFHGDPGLAGIAKMLRKTHTVTQLDSNPVNGIFEAVRK
jgi:FkbM family methyltransferase